MANSKRVWREHKVAVWSGGAVAVTVLALAGGTVVYALDGESGAAQPKRCATALQGAASDVSDVVVSDSGEYAASGGFQVTVWKGEKVTTLDDASGEVVGVSSDGTVVGEDDEPRPTIWCQLPDPVT